MQKNPNQSSGQDAPRDPEDRTIQRRKFLAGMALGAGLAPLATMSGIFRARPEAAAAAAAADLCYGKTLLSPADFVYLGLAKMPSQGGNPFRYTNGGLTGRYVNGQLRLIMSGPSQAVVGDLAPTHEFSMPTNLTKSVGTAPPVTITQSWADIFAGQGSNLVNPAGVRNWGIHWDEPTQALWWTFSTYYNGQVWNPSIGASALNANGGVTKYGPWRTSVHSARTAAYMLALPAWFQPAVGGKRLGVGTPPHVNNALCSFGANLHAWNPPALSAAPDSLVDTTQQSIQATPLLFHPIDKPQARGANYKTCGWNVPYDNSQGGRLQAGAPWFGGVESGTLLDWMDVAVWIDLPSKHGILFLGQLADTIAGRTYVGDANNQAHVWYGPGTCIHGQTAAVHGATGPGAGTLVNQAWLYDPTDLLQTASGSKPSHGLTPRAEFRAKQLGGFCQEERTQLNQFPGAYFDAQTQRLYVSEVNAYVENNEWLPVVHAFQVT